MKKIGIITIAFNGSKLIEYQIKTIKKYCSDDYEFIVVDNSTKNNEIERIKNICTENNIRLINTNINLTNSYNNPSNNHGLTLNYVYNFLKNDFDYLLFIDHDLFPIKEFSVEQILGDNIIAGCKQTISNTDYLWPGFLILSKLDEQFDFTPIPPLDTGGRLHTFISNNINKVFFIEHSHVPIDLKLNNDYMHEFYDELYDGTFIHFIKSSNWCNVNDEIFNLRQDYLFKILDNFIKEKTQAI
jgi:glycosyltransferase involved in cell wall biosynthesis